MEHLRPYRPTFSAGFSLILFCFPFLLLYGSPQKIESLVGPLTEAQHAWLAEHPITKQALAEIAGSYHWSAQQQAEAIFDHFTKEAAPILSAWQMAQEVAILKVLHPYWSPARTVFAAAWNVISDQTHQILDLAGLVPALGEGADLVNGVFYCIEGDKANAALSFAAMVPVAGWTAIAAKYAGFLVVTAKGAKATLKLTKLPNGFIDFGRRNQLATIIGKKANHQAHHIIPWEFVNNRVLQQAAKSNKFHMNLSLNGINLNLSVHNGFLTKEGHKIYNERISDELDKVLNDLGYHISPNEAFSELEIIIHKVRLQFEQGKKLNEIVF